MTLQTLWFCLVSVLWGGYFVLEGFDFGVGMLLPVVSREERDRQAMLDTIGPVWDGNEVWLVVAAGATFAAFPSWYATMFSGFYVGLLLVLCLLIVRVVSFEWRSKVDSAGWRRTWLSANAVASVGAPFLWGMLLANLLHGVPLTSSGDFAGGIADLFSPYTVFAGLATVVLFAFHGATFLTLRTAGALQRRTVDVVRRLAPAAGVVVAALLVWTVVVATDTNQRGVLPVALPAAAGIVAIALAAAFTRAAR